MKIRNTRRAVVVRVACPVCHEPARPRPPRVWHAFNGPRPGWSHVDGEPLCPVGGANGYRPARRGCAVTATRLARTARRTSATRPARAVTRRSVRCPGVSLVRADAMVYLVAGGDMVAVFDTPEAAGIQYTVMVGANLDPYARRVTATQWEQARAQLTTDRGIKIIDARRTRPEVTS